MPCYSVFQKVLDETAMKNINIKFTKLNVPYKIHSRYLLISHLIDSIAAIPGAEARNS